jgi:hypothetical protein
MYCKIIGSLNLLVFKLDRFAVHKYTLALVRLRHPPIPDIRCKLHDHLFLWSFQQKSRRLRGACGDALGHAELDWMGVADLKIHELLTRVFRFDGGGCVLN